MALAQLKIPNSSAHDSQTLALKHQVLNARQDQKEAEIIASAGELNSVTIATNMAGRGTDISVSSEACDAGGLHVILTEKHESRRIDRQLAGRCARQGDPGSVETLISLEDSIAKLHQPLIFKLAQHILLTHKPTLPNFLGAIPIRMAQKREERFHAKTRLELHRSDKKLTDLLAFTGRSV